MNRTPWFLGVWVHIFGFGWSCTPPLAQGGVQGQSKYGSRSNYLNQRKSACIHIYCIYCLLVRINGMRKNGKLWQLKKTVTFKTYSNLANKTRSFGTPHYSWSSRFSSNHSGVRADAKQKIVALCLSLRVHSKVKIILVQWATSLREYLKLFSLWYVIVHVPE